MTLLLFPTGIGGVFVLLRSRSKVRRRYAGEHEKCLLKTNVHSRSRKNSEKCFDNHFYCVLSFFLFNCEGRLASESDKDCPAIINSCEDNRGCTRYHDVSVKASGEVAM